MGLNREWLDDGPEELGGAQHYVTGGAGNVDRG